MLVLVLAPPLVPLLPPRENTCVLYSSRPTWLSLSAVGCRPTGVPLSLPLPARDLILVSIFADEGKKNGLVRGEVSGRQGVGKR